MFMPHLFICGCTEFHILLYEGVLIVDLCNKSLYYLHEVYETTNQKKEISEMKESRKKAALDYLMERLDTIDEKYDSLRNKSSMWKKAVDKVKRDLRDENDKGELAISLNTYHGYLGDIREAVKQTNRKHPGLTSTLSRKGYLNTVISLLPDYESDLRGIAEMPALTIHQGVKALKNKIKKDLNGTPRNKAVAALKTLLIHHPVVMALEKEDAEKEDRADERREALEEKTKNKKVYNGPALIAKAISLLEHESYTARAWALALLTGRRAVEIIYHAKFEYMTDNVVMFSGQAKKPVGTEDTPYPIPVLADSKLIISALESFRTLPEVSVFVDGHGSYEWREDVAYSDLTRRELNRAINHRTSGVLNARAKSITGDDSEVFKNTRIIYAEYCKQHCRDLTPEWSTMADDAFLRAILGHDQLGEVKHYNQSEVKNDEGGDWLKVPEPKKEDDKAKEEAPAQPATRNWRATKGIKEMGEAIDAYTERFIQTPARKINMDKVRRFHFSELRFWAANNPNSKITQTAVTKNKGHTLASGTGEINFKTNRYTFQAWVQIVGADNVEAYNAGKEDA